MSLSNPIKANQSPVKRYYKWNGTKGCISYYDKDTSTNIEMSMPVTIIPIDQLSCVEGFNTKASNGFRSNEVRSTQKEQLTIKWNGGSIITTGFYSAIKDKLKVMGGSYNQSVYFTMVINGKMEICNIKLKGAALSAWLNMNKQLSSSVEGNQLIISTSDMQKTGNVEYYIPIFKISKPSVADHKLATDLDYILQEYLVNRDKMSEGEQTSQQFLGDDVDTSTPSTDEILGMNKMKQAFKSKPAKTPKDNTPFKENTDQSMDDLWNNA